MKLKKKFLIAFGIVSFLSLLGNFWYSHIKNKLFNHKTSFIPDVAVSTITLNKPFVHKDSSVESLYLPWQNLTPISTRAKQNPLMNLYMKKSASLVTAAELNLNRSANSYQPLKLPVNDEIPRILHQTYINDMIPPKYVEHAQTWTLHKPPLLHLFWSNQANDQFVAKNYPSFLPKFRSYGHDLSRADSIRYLLLHHYGGIYADFDLTSLRSLEPLLKGEKCVISQERYEQTNLLWDLKRSIMNAFMMVVPGHMFMDYIVQQLPVYHNRTLDVLSSTGPMFLTEVYEKYVSNPLCDLTNPYCSCLIADPYLFLPQIDPSAIWHFRNRCQNENSRMSALKRSACAKMNSVGWQNDLSVVAKTAYTHHTYLHYGYNPERFIQSKVKLSDKFPDILHYGTDFI